MRICIDCIHWKPTGERPYEGFCMTSVICTNSESHLSRFTSKTEMSIPKKIFMTGEPKVKGRIAFMTNEDLTKAIYSKQKQSPEHPDMRELTDESKKELRKGRRKHVSETA